MVTSNFDAMLIYNHFKRTFAFESLFGVCRFLQVDVTKTGKNIDVDYCFIVS